MTHTLPFWGKPCVARMHVACGKTHYGWTLRLDVCVRYAPGAKGRGGPAEGHGRWKHKYVTAVVRTKASAKSKHFCTTVIWLEKYRWPAFAPLGQDLDAGRPF